jgi:hypothetical protein
MKNSKNQKEMKNVIVVQIKNIKSVVYKEKTLRGDYLGETMQLEAGLFLKKNNILI